MNDSGSNSNADRLGKAYWDRLWTGRKPALIDPELGGYRNYVIRAKHRFFSQVIDNMAPRPARFLEIGCGSSEWLPYFARQFGLEVWGIDYSEIGCTRARELLERAGMIAKVVCADLFEPPAAMLDYFDIVASIGVVEHFEDTAGCLRACARFLKPGGTMITIIPNLSGILGPLQKHIDRAIFEGHVVLDCAQLLQANRDAGLEDCTGSYFLGFNLGILNFAHYRFAAMRRLASAGCGTISRAVWALEGLGIGFKPNRITSPLITCVARKPSWTSAQLARTKASANPAMIHAGAQG